MQTLNSTAHKILDVAEHHTQLSGFNAFSYKDIQHEVGVKTSSIHYYFPTKQDLALAMTERYIERFGQYLQTINSEELDGFERLARLGQIYVDIVSTGKFCMCGMLASDMLSLPDAVHSKLCEFFRLSERWIADAIELGKSQGTVGAMIDSAQTAPFFLSALEGAMLIARTQGRPEYLENVVEESLERIKH